MIGEQQFNRIPIEIYTPKKTTEIEENTDYQIYHGIRCTQEFDKHSTNKPSGPSLVTITTHKE